MAENNYWTKPGRWRTNRRQILGVAASGGGVLLLAGCGARGSRQTSQAGGSSSGKPRTGGQITSAQSEENVSFDASTKLAASARGNMATCESLMSFKSGPSIKWEDLQIQPRLAEKYETPDPQTYIFHLRSGVKWQNLPPINGRALEAADVKWTYEYMSRTGPVMSKLPPAPAASMFSGLERVDTPDASTVIVRFGQPFVPFIGYSASEWTPILAHEIYDADGDFKAKTIGTGPFYLDTSASQKGTRMVHKKNPNYWMQGRPYVDQFNILIITDTPTMNSAFQTGQLDTLDYSGLDGRTADAIQKAAPNAVVQQFSDSNNPYYVYLNVAKPPFNDERIRKALSPRDRSR